jgi:hypothetical protein
VAAQSTHEAARRRGEAALVVSDEADDHYKKLFNL